MTEENAAGAGPLHIVNEQLRAHNQELVRKLDALSQINADLDHLIAWADCGVIFLDHDLCLIRATAWATMQFDLRAADIGQPLSQSQHPLIGAVLRDAEQVLASHSPIERELQHSDGRWLLMRIHLYHDKATPHGLTVFFIDITGRKLIHRQLQFQAQLLGSVQQAVVATDMAGTVTYWNPAAERIYGWPAAEALGRNIVDLTVPQIGQEQAQAILELLQAGERWSGEHVVCRSDGSTFPAIVTDTPVYDQDGALIGIVGISTDISAQKQVEATLQESVARLHQAQQALTERARQQSAVAEIAQQALKGKDLDAYLDDVCALVSRTLAADCCAVLERSSNGHFLRLRAGCGWPDGLVGHTTLSARTSSLMSVMLQSPEPLAVADMRVKRGFSIPTLFRRQHIVSAVGTVIPDHRKHPYGILCACMAEQRAFSVDEQHFLQTVANVLAVVIAHNQLEADRRQLLLDIEAAQEAERQHIARELHDELGQYLAALLLHVTALAEDGVLTLAATTHLEHVRQIAQQLSREVHHLAIQLRPTALDDLGLQASLINYLEDWTQRTAIPVEYQSSGLAGTRLPPMIETAIYRVVQEALTNVLQHAGASHVSLVVDRRPQEIVVVVEDDGRGFNVGAALRGPAGGRRLGLRGMRERVALLSGTITLESSPGVGTSLYARIPLPRQL